MRAAKRQSKLNVGFVIIYACDVRQVRSDARQANCLREKWGSVPNTGIFLHVWVCVCVCKICVKSDSTGQKDIHTHWHTHTEIWRKVACRSKLHRGLNTTLSPFSVFKMAALIGLPVYFHTLPFYTYMCVSSCSFLFPFFFAVWINIWRIIYYLSDTSFIYRVEIIWYIFQFCHGWSTFYHLLQGMSQTSAAELESAATETPHTVARRQMHVRINRDT